jgi:hypothetical protein
MADKISMRRSLFKFFSSLKLAVFCILLLATVLGTATVLESLYGMRAAHVLVYGTPWFAGVLVLLGTNVFCAAMSRYPWKRHQTGFLITHAGILTLLIGSFLTQQFGVDGNLPVTEGTQDGEVILNDLRLTVTDEATGTKQSYPLVEYATEKQGRLLSVALPSGEKFEVTRFIPRATLERSVTASPVEGVGAPAIRVELANSRFQIEEWVLNDNPGPGTELNLGPAILSFRRLSRVDEEKKFLSHVAAEPERKDKIGLLVAEFKGREYRLPISPAVKQWSPIGSTGLELSVERYLPFAVVKDNRLVSRSDDPGNPAVELWVKNEKGEKEKHTIFANFPEFSTLHRKHAEMDRAFHVKFRMIASAGGHSEMAIVGNQRGRLEFAQSADGKRLFYRAIGKSGALNGAGLVKVNEPTVTGWMDLKFTVRDWFPYAVDEEIPHSVEYISGGNANYLSALQVKLVQGRETATENTAWLFEGAGRSFSVGARRVAVQFTKERLTLPFQLFLEKFTIGTDPGTTKAATYESDVRVKDPAAAAKADKVKISMNEPLKHGGYTFYQASYQLEEGSPPVSIFSVNFDPGRTIKYLGSLIMVLGISLMFYMNPHYWNKILGRKKEA